MSNILKLCFKRDMESPNNPEKLVSPNINSGFESFPPRFDTVGERTLTCPTCEGTGRLTQELQKDLVALIPVRDKRLKSRKKVYILIAVLVIILVAGGLSAFFLFPRDIHLKLLDSEAFNITLAPRNGTTAYMYLNNTLQINNSNYFDIIIKNVNQQVTWGGASVVADTTFEGHMHVPSKSSVTHHFNVKLVYKGEQLCAKMKRACCWFHLMFIIVTNANADGVTVSQDVSNKVYEYVECLEDDPDWIQKCRDTS